MTSIPVFLTTVHVDAILSWVVRNATGLYPKDDLEAAYVDAVVDCLTDNDMALLPSFKANDEAQKVKLACTRDSS